jgi:UDP-N-acetylglucosamine transferase subunit ALG13
VCPESALVFVTVGTDVHPFARIVEWIDRWLAGPGAGSRVVVQYGTSPAPAQAEGMHGEVSLPYSEMRRYISEAAVVVCHGGPGTIMEARRIGAEPIVVPRRHDLGEHVDNHQMHFARKLAANDGLRLAEDYAAFAALLTAGVQDPTLFRIPPRPALGPGVTKFGEAVAALGPRRRNRSRARRTARAGSLRQNAGDAGHLRHLGDRADLAELADTEVAEIFAKESARPYPGRPPVLFIAGWGRSGSTLVDRTLGSVHGVTSLGELRDLWTRGIVENRLCGCGEPFLSCPFWTEVGQRAFGGWDNLDLERLRRLRALVDRPWTLPLLIWPVIPSFHRARNEYAATLDTLLDGIASVSGASLLVESTKIATFAVLLRVTGRQVKMLHLVRDSRGVMYSWGKRVQRSDGSGVVAAVPGVAAGDTMARYGSVSGSLRYWIYNGLAQLVGRTPPTRMPYRRLRYEDFIADPIAARAAILDFAGVDAPLELASNGEVRLGVCHTVDGNPSRTQSGTVKVRLDDEWRRSMSPGSRALVTLLTAPMLGWYGYLSSGTRAEASAEGEPRPGVLRRLDGGAAGADGNSVERAAVGGFTQATEESA